jgi:hypothetical protein
VSVVWADATALDPFACSSIEQQQETAARDMVGRFAQVRIDEGGWLESGDKLFADI